MGKRLSLWAVMYGCEMRERGRKVNGVQKVFVDGRGAAAAVLFDQLVLESRSRGQVMGQGRGTHTSSLLNLVQQPPQAIAHLAPPLARLARHFNQTRSMRFAEGIAMRRLYFQHRAGIAFTGKHDHRQALLCYSLCSSAGIRWTMDRGK